MSQENVEIVRSINEAFARGDFEEVLDRLDPAFEMVGPPDVTAGGQTSHGHRETVDLMGTFLSAWGDYRFEVHDVIDAGDRILIEGKQQARGRGSGVKVSESVYTVWTVEAGMATKTMIFRGRDEALEAAGLSE
jgi:ketosteroid isomerase-like protein